MLALLLPDGALAVRLTRSPRRRVRLRVSADALDVVADPSLSLAQLQALIERHRDWIASRWQRCRLEQQQCANSPAQVCVHGVALPLRLQQAARGRVVIGSEAVTVYAPQLDGAAVRQALARALARYARAQLPQRLAAYAPCLVRTPSALRLSSARTRWGSCTASGTVRLNWRLIQAPLPVFDYVLAHELAHLVHLNHSPAFWAEVARLCPSWQDARGWLKTHGATLFALG